MRTFVQIDMFYITQIPMELWVCFVIYGAAVNNTRMTFSARTRGFPLPTTRASSCSIKRVGENKLQLFKLKRDDGKQELSGCSLVFV